MSTFTSAPPSTEQNKAIVVRLVEATNRRTLAALDDHPGLLGTKEFLTSFFAAFPDAQATIEELVAEGEWVAARLITRGTQQGEWRGAPPSGHPISTEVLAMHRIVDGRIVTAHIQSGRLDHAS